MQGDHDLATPAELRLGAPTRQFADRAVFGVTAARVLAPAAIVIATVAAYLSALVVPYAFMDDYWNLAAVHGLGGIDPWKFSTQGGRPIGGFLLVAGFRAIPDIDALRILRLVSACGTALLGLLLYYALRRGRVNRWLSAGISVSIITLPPFEVYVGWSTLFWAPYAAILAGVSWLRMDAGVRRRVEACVLLLVALLIYQPAAMFFWVFAAIDVLRPTEGLAYAKRKLATGLGVAVVALAVGYLVARIGYHFYGTLGNGRSRLVDDLVGKIEWFGKQPLVNALNFYDLTPSVAVACAVAAIAAIGIVLLHVQRRWESLGFLGIAALFVPLAYLPNLVIAEEWASYRSLGALSALLMLYVWLGAWGIARCVARAPVYQRFRTTNPWRGVALGAGALATVVAATTAVILAARNVTTLFAKPENVELQMLRNALGNSSASPIQRVEFIKPDWTQGAAPFVRYDEFGLPSSYAPWVPDPAVLLVLRENHQESNPVIDILAWDAPVTARPSGLHAVIVDMRKLQQRRVHWSLWTLHGA